MSPLRAVDAYEITCDQKGCYAFTPPAYNESLAEQDGESLGWKKVHQPSLVEPLWFCPDHKPDDS